MDDDCLIGKTIQTKLWHINAIQHKVGMLHASTLIQCILQARNVAFTLLSFIAWYNLQMPASHIILL